MKDRLCFIKEKRPRQGETRIVIAIFLFTTFLFFSGQALAQTDLELFGRDLTISGYINQGVQFGVAGDHYDTMQGFQAAIMQALLELEYHPMDNVKLMVTGMLNKDWAYDILDSDDDWEEKRFDKSRSELSLFSDYEDYLKECHVTWTPESWNIRVGKQVISWGRMDGRTIMNQINPEDVRRGIADVEYETRLMPIWLAKVEYYPGISLPGLTDYALEAIFNPNADFIPSKRFSTGNDYHGIWAPDAVNGPYRVGVQDFRFEEPDSWNSEGYEYGFRFTGTLKTGTFFTLNYFNGIANNAIQRPAPGSTFPPWTDTDGRTVVQPVKEGYYADQEYAGFTFTHDFQSLYLEALGGVAPVIRCEALYGFDSMFRSDGFGYPYDERFEEHDEIYWGMGIDWKFRWNLLNPRRFFSFIPEFSQRHIRDYPSDYNLRDAGDASMPENHYIVSVRMDTWYLHDKLQPFVFWLRDIKNNKQGDMWLFKLVYQPNTTWKYTLALYLLENEYYDTVGSGLPLGTHDERTGLGHKDNLSFTVQYQF